MIQEKDFNQNIVVLDWSNLMFRSLFMTNLFKDSNVSYDDNDDVDSFIGKFCTDVLALVKTFHPTKVIIAVDAQYPWRKDILPQGDEDALSGYKGTRTKTNKINWDNIFKASTDFLEVLENKGMHIARIDRAEADDICALVKEVAFEEYPKANVIIISADADIRQLIDFNNNEHQYCVVYNTIPRGKTGKRYLYATKEFIDFVNSPDVNDIFFSNVDPVKSYWKRIFSESQFIELVEENPQNIALGKIFCGDDGDNVPAFYEWETATRKARVTNSKFEKILADLDVQTVSGLLIKESCLQASMEKVLKRKIEDIDFHERLIRQRKLVELNSELFPAHIRNYKDTLMYMFNNRSVLDYDNLKTSKVLEGSRFAKLLDRKRRKVEKAVFQDIDKYVAGMTKLI